MSVDGRPTVIGYNSTYAVVLYLLTQVSAKAIHSSHASLLYIFKSPQRSGKLFTFIAHVPYALCFTVHSNWYDVEIFWPY